MAVSAPSGVMFVTALLVGRGKSRTSNIGDKGQDVITMEDERACLPLYLIHTRLKAGQGHAHGYLGMAPPLTPAFGGTGTKLGGRGI